VSHRHCFHPSAMKREQGGVVVLPKDNTGARDGATNNWRSDRGRAAGPRGHEREHSKTKINELNRTYLNSTKQSSKTRTNRSRQAADDDARRQKGQKR
jgi:hypothetical protein